MDLQRKRELSDQGLSVPKTNGTNENRKQEQESNGEERNGKEMKPTTFPSHLPKRTVNQQTSPTKPYLYCPPVYGKDDNSHGILRKSNKYNNKSPPKEKPETFGNTQEPTKNGDIMEKRKSMSRISEERIDVEGENISSTINGNENEPHITEDDPTLKFPNLVDSVRVAEDRLSFTQKGIRNLKSLKYIFPTSYIGNSTTSQATVNLSNSTSTFCKMIKKPEIGMEKNSPSSHSGIPIPTNGHNGKTSGFLSSIITAKKLIKKPESKTEVVPITENNAEEKNEEIKNDLMDASMTASVDLMDASMTASVNLMNASMTTSLYIGNGTTEKAEEPPKQTKEETVTSGSSSASVITSPSEDTPAASEDKKAKEPEGQTFK